MKRHFLIFIVFAALLASGQSFAADLKVSAEGSAPYSTIQEAIDAAVNGDRVIVADGTYKGDKNKDLDYKGKAITVMSESGPQNCIIDCEKSGRAFTFYHNETETSVVSGFTIINANHADGGAIRCGKYNPGDIYTPPKATEETGSPTISNCIFRDNFTDYAGGAIIINSSDPIIKDCRFENNRAKQYGGAIAFMNESDPKVINCGFTGNSAYSGGAVHAEESQGELVGLYVAENYTTSVYGVPPGYDGGGICIRKSQTKIERCTVLRNKSYWGAGISVKINSAVTIESCLIAENEGERGGGISVKKSEAKIYGCTVTKNKAPGGNNDFEGIGGIYNEEVGSEVSNCIIWGNSNGQIAADKESAYPTITYSNVEGCPAKKSGKEYNLCEITAVWDSANNKYAGAGNINADPLFTGNGDYHLTPGSPCLTTGTSVNAPTYDLDNKTRAEDGVFAMGAYEEAKTGGKDSPVKQSSSGSGCFIGSLFMPDASFEIPWLKKIKNMLWDSNN